MAFDQSQRAQGPAYPSVLLFFATLQAKAVYYTVIKYNEHLRTRGKCRKHEWVQTWVWSTLLSLFLFSCQLLSSINRLNLHLKCIPLLNVV